MRILIGGDVCPIGINESHFKSGDNKSILNDLLDEFENSDLNIVNLECPLINKAMPISKAGPVLGVSSECISGLKNIGINIINLANNHILDHGEQGLINTVLHCKEAGIETVGAGENLKEASAILSIERKDIKVGVVAFAEHEFSIATKNTAGANPLDLISCVNILKIAREKYDFFIILYHGGKEFYPYPSPMLQKYCRFMIEQGASAVICQHSHCSGCYEKWNGGHIIYGQGNLIFDGGNCSHSDWNEGFLIRFDITNRNNASIDFVPFLQSNGQPGARRMNKRQRELFFEQFCNRSGNIKDEDFVVNKWHETCLKEKYYFFSILRGHSRLLKGINKYTHFSNMQYSQKKLLLLKNAINCESHREVLQSILSKTS